MSSAAAMYGLPAGPSIIKVYIYIYIYVTLHYLYTIHQCGRRPCIVGKTLGTQAKFEVLRSDYTRNFATYICICNTHEFAFAILMSTINPNKKFWYVCGGALVVMATGSN